MCFFLPSSIITSAQSEASLTNGSPPPHPEGNTSGRTYIIPQMSPMCTLKFKASFFFLSVLRLKSLRYVSHRPVCLLSETCRVNYCSPLCLRSGPSGPRWQPDTQPVQSRELLTLVYHHRVHHERRERAERRGVGAQTPTRVSRQVSRDRRAHNVKTKTNQYYLLELVLS